MGVCQIGDDIIADTGAVSGRVIRTEDFQRGAVARSSDRQRDQVGLWIVHLTDISVSIAPGCVK